MLETLACLEIVIPSLQALADLLGHESVVSRVLDGFQRQRLLEERFGDCKRKAIAGAQLAPYLSLTTLLSNKQQPNFDPIVSFKIV